MSITYWARTTSNTANADTLVVGNDSAVELTFTSDSPFVPGEDSTGDLTIEGGGATTAFGEIDPDTWAVVGNTTYRVVYDGIGGLPNDNKVPPSLQTIPPTEVIVVRLYSLTDPPVLVASYFFVHPPLAPLTAEDIMNDFGNGNIRLVGEDLTPDPEVLCFRAGTDIATPSGQRPVEGLRAGDMVLTEDGRAVQVVWVGKSVYSAAALASDPALRPVRVRANAFGPGLPLRDLDVSPQHRVMVSDPACDLLFGESSVLVPAKFLVGTCAETVEPEEDVVYVHVLLQDHDMLVSNGLPSESFQPARRTVGVMDASARIRIEAVIEALGDHDLLTRKDRYLSLRKAEAEVLMDALSQRAGGIAGAAGHVAAALRG